MAPRRVSAENLEVVELVFEAIGFKEISKNGVLGVDKIWSY